MKKSTFLHLRIFFSFYLLPVFLLACGVAGKIDREHFWLALVALHFFIYPASNGYNSYFDKDEKSIGGLKDPPPVSKELYWTSLALDAIGLVLGALISLEFVAMVFVYGLVSKAYSHPAIRLKKMPFTGWLAAGIFQGYFTFLLSYVALADISISQTFEWAIHWPGILSSALLLGSYPMTQIYQHEEDAKRKDLTISRLLGVKGTFHFSATMFFIAATGFAWYFLQYHELADAFLFLAFLIPVITYFLLWYSDVRKDAAAANFSRTMKLNFISSLCLNVFFLFWWIN